MDYVDSSRTIQLKGRVACEIYTCESMIVTEFIFNNILTPLSPEYAVALLSCLIFQQRLDDAPPLPESLACLDRSLLEITTSLANLQLKAGLDTSPQQFYKENVNCGLMEIAYEWTIGTVRTINVFYYRIRTEINSE